MALISWWLLGWLGLVLTQAISTRFSIAHIMPDVVWVICAYVALRLPVGRVVTVVLPLSYLLGRAALAPLGLFELALITVALGLSFASGNFTGAGPVYFAFVCAAGEVAHTLVACLLLVWHHRQVGFSSWATVLLVPQAFATGVLGALMFVPLAALERRLTPRAVQGLTWH